MSDASPIAQAVLDKIGARPAQKDTPKGEQSVADLLKQSVEAHVAYRNALRENNDVGATQSITEAASARSAAELADPDHADPAWKDELLHVDLLKFYLDLLSR